MMRTVMFGIAPNDSEVIMSNFKTLDIIIWSIYGKASLWLVPILELNLMVICYTAVQSDQNSGFNQ